MTDVVASPAMEPEDMPPPTAEANGPNIADLEQVLLRQHRVIDKLKEQIGNIVLANTEAAARMDEYQLEIGELKAELESYRTAVPLAP